MCHKLHRVASSDQSFDSSIPGNQAKWNFELLRAGRDLVEPSLGSAASSRPSSPLVQREVGGGEKMPIKMAGNHVGQNTGVPFREEIRRKVRTERGQLGVLGWLQTSLLLSPRDLTWPLKAEGRRWGVVVFFFEKPAAFHYHSGDLDPTRHGKRSHLL